MLTSGFNHVAVLTADTGRFVDFYREVFGAEELGSQDMGGHGRLTFVRIGEEAEFNVFEVTGNTEAERQTPMLGRGRLDHLALQAASLEAFEEIRRRLIARGASRRIRRPTSARSCRCSSGTPTGSSARCAWPTPTPSPAS